MKALFKVCVSIRTFSSTLFSAPLDVKPVPPVSDPHLPTEKDPFIVYSSNANAHSPGKCYVYTSWCTQCITPLSHGAEVLGVNAVHHQDLNKKIWIALIVALTLLGVILLFLE